MVLAFRPDGRTLLLTGRADEERGLARTVYLARLVRRDALKETHSVSEGPDAANRSAADLLATGEYEWQVVEKLPEPISSRADEQSADMSDDGLTIVFNSFRQSAEKPDGNHDLWMATRNSIDEPWSDPVLLNDEISTEQKLSLTHQHGVISYQFHCLEVNFGNSLVILFLPGKQIPRVKQ